MSDRWTRRRVLASGSVAIGGLAGCLGGSDGDDGNETTMTDGDETGGDSTDTGDGGQSDGGGADDDPIGDETDGDDGGNVSDGGGDEDDGSGDDGELDLREANVTAVSIEEVGDRTFEFSVTLIHDDDGEDGYANWWAVETKDV